MEITFEHMVWLISVSDNIRISTWVSLIISLVVFFVGLVLKLGQHTGGQIDDKSVKFANNLFITGSVGIVLSLIVLAFVPSSDDVYQILKAMAGNSLTINN